MNRAVRLFIGICLSLAITACGLGQNANDGKKIINLVVPTLNTSSTMAVGDSQELTIFAAYDDNSQENVTPQISWSVEDGSILSINEQGKITALAEGQTRVVINYDGFSLTLDIKVINSKPVSVVSLEIITAGDELIEGSTVQLGLIATMSDASKKNIPFSATWTSSDEAIVAVSDKGVVSPLAISAETVTITASIGDVSVEKAFTVVEKSELRIALSPAVSMLHPAQTQTLELRHVFNNGQYEVVEGGISWASSDLDVATVTDGVVTAQQTGQANITASYDGEDYRAVVIVGDEHFTIKKAVESPKAYYEKYVEGSDKTKETNISAHFDSTTYSAVNSGTPNLIVELKDAYTKSSKTYQNTLTISLNQEAKEGTLHADDDFSFDYSDENIDIIFRDFLTLTRVGDVEQLVVGNFGFWGCNSNEGCQYYTGDFVAKREPDLLDVTQGSIAEPLDLGAMPMQPGETPNTVSTTEFSYYKISVVEGGTYRVSIQSSSYMELFVYGNPDFSSDQLCNRTSSNVYCDVTASGDTLYIKVRNYWLNQARSFHLSVFGGVDEGADNQPLDISDSSANYLGQVSSSGASYYKVKVNPSSVYDVAGSTQEFGSSYVRVILYRDADFSSSMGSFNTNAERTIVTDADQEYLYVMVTTTNYGKYFYLNISEHAFLNEGSSETPKSLTLDEEDSADLQVGKEASYYTLSVDSQKQYTVEIYDLFDNADLYIYSDPQFTQELCSSTQTGDNDETCRLGSGVSTLYIKVSGANLETYNGTDFTLSYYQYFSSQGSVDSPMDLGAVPFSDVSLTAGYNPNSYYKIDVAENTAYRLNIDLATSYMYVYVYENSGFSGQLCSAYGRDPVQPCDFQTSSGQTSVYVRIFTYDNAGVSYNMSIAERVFSTEGSVGSPVDIGKANTGVLSAVNNTASFFTFSGAPGKDYRVSLRNHFDNIDLEVYTDAFSSLACSSANPGTSIDACIVTMPPTGKLYVSVLGTNATTYGGTSFYMDARREYPTQGASGVGNPQDLGVAPVTETLGSVGYGNLSYYQAQVTPGKEYLILVDQVLDQDVNIVAYSDVDYSSSLSCSNRRNYNTTGCVTPAMVGDKLYFTVSGRGFFSSASYKVSVVEKPANQGDTVTPVDLGVAPFTMKAGVVAGAGTSYYQVAVSENTTYHIELNGSNYYLDLAVYYDSGFSNKLVCSSSSSYGRICDYTTTAGQTMLYLTATSSYQYVPENGALFGISVAESPVSQGTSSAPFALAAAPLADELIATSSQNGFYTVDVAENTEYSIVLKDASYGAYLDVYTSDSFSSLACSVSYNYYNYYARCDYLTQPGQTKLYLRIRTNTSVGGYLNLSVDATP